MGRAPCCDKANVKRGPWSPEEDATLKRYVETHGTGGNWIALPQKAGLRRCGKSCRLRWLNYLRPDIKHGNFTEEEDGIICTLYSQLGSRWSLIASHLPGRTDNDVKNYWNTKLKKKLYAGKVLNLTTTNKNNFSPTTTLLRDSKPPPKSELTYDHDHDNLFFNSPSSQTQFSSSLPPVSSDFNGYGMRNADQSRQFPVLLNSEFGTSNYHLMKSTSSPNVATSTSQEGSSIEDSEIFMNDFGFGSLPNYDQFVINGLSWFHQEKASQVPLTSCYTDLLTDGNISYADDDHNIKPQAAGLNQSVINQY